MRVFKIKFEILEILEMEFYKLSLNFGEFGNFRNGILKN